MHKFKKTCHVKKYMQEKTMIVISFIANFIFQTELEKIWSKNLYMGADSVYWSSFCSVLCSFYIHLHLKFNTQPIQNTVFSCIIAPWLRQ